MTKNPYRLKMAEQAIKWLDFSVDNGLHKKIIDIYNQYPKEKRPRNGVNMQYDWPWCACTWSSIVIACDMTNICPIEISCGELINQAKKMGCWTELDNYVADIGDAILYDWDDDGKGDCTGWPDHVGIIVDVDVPNKKFTVIEGNYSNKVKKRVIGFDSKYIRGFVTPAYELLWKDEEKTEDKPIEKDFLNYVALDVILGFYGNMPERKTRVEAAGYDYEKVQNRVNLLRNTVFK